MAGELRTVDRWIRPPKGHTIMADTFRCPLCGGKFLARKRNIVKYEGEWIGVCRICKHDIRSAERT